MARDHSENIDDYCREKFGHTNWGYLSTYEDHELEHAQNCGSAHCLIAGSASPSPNNSSIAPTE